MTRRAVDGSYPQAPEGFSLLREYDPATGLNYYRVKFTASIEQTLTDELVGSLSLSGEQIWDSAIRELTSNIQRRFS